MLVVSNSSPIIALERIGRLDLLRAVFPELIVPPAVAEEIGRTALPHSWLAVRALGKGPDSRTISGGLGAGEREAISLALELGHVRVLLDDQAARRVARELGLPVVGTLGTLLAAKRKGLMRAIRPDLEKLRAAGFFMSTELFRRLLRLANE